MATVFMKWLETRPKDYERGIWLLTMGRLARIQEQLVEQQIKEGMNVLEIGCGTGKLACLMAEAGANVTAIDANSAMLAEAQQRVTNKGFAERINLKLLDASLIGEVFKPASYELIVVSLVFSELPPDVQRYVLEACADILQPDGQLMIIDEVVPENNFFRIIFSLIRLPLVIITWLLTRTSTHALPDFEHQLKRNGFTPTTSSSFLGGSLMLYSATPGRDIQLDSRISGNLSYRVTLKSCLVDLWALFFRIMPPYPKVKPGLYTVGSPDENSPVLVTGNFDLTVRRLLREIDGKINSWLLVVDSKGINVWCAAGGGYLTASKVVAGIKACDLDSIVKHHNIILPQLCANGVDGWKIKSESGFRVLWGPVRAADIIMYLDKGMVKDEKMRSVDFPLITRLEMCTVTLGFYSLIIILPVFLFWRNSLLPITFTLLGLSYFYAMIHPWLPGKDGLYKSIPLALIALFFLMVYTILHGSITCQVLYNWVFGLTGLSLFVAAEMQGMSPLMRGEQANWGWEIIIGLILAGLYWSGQFILGWR